MSSATRLRPQPARPDPRVDTGRPARLPGVDGIRALAVLAVLVYHVHGGWLPGGFLGVDVFFVISGYLITRLLVAEHRRTGRIDLRAFWTRRARRILPPLVPVLLATTVAIALVDRTMLRALRTELLGAVTYTSNWVQIAGHHSYFARFDAPSVLQHLWSLAVEEQFYLLWPLAAVLVLWRGHHRLAVVAGLGAVISTVLMASGFRPGADPSRLYFGTDTHCAGLLIGAALAVVWPAATCPAGHRRVRSARALVGVVGLAIVLTGLFALSQFAALTYRGGITIVCVGTALLIVGVAAGRNPVGRILASRPARWLGARSYALYLWHWPVLVIGDRIAGGHRTVPVGIAEVCCAIGLSALSWRYLERPILRHGLGGLVAKHWHAAAAGRARYRALLIAGGAACVAVCCGAVLAVVDAPAPPHSGLAAQLASARRSVSSTDELPTAVPTVPAADSDVPAAPPRGDQITALGDSVMLASAGSLQQALPGIDINAKVSRAMQRAPALLAGMARRGSLRHVVLIGLGTNGPFPRHVLEKLIHQLGDRSIYLVNAYVPTRPWQAEVNHTLTTVANRHGNVHMINWHGVIASRTDLLWPDHIHPRPGAGTKLYASTVADAMGGRPTTAPAGNHRRPGPNTDW